MGLRRRPATLIAGRTSPAHCPRACPIMWRWLRAVVCADELCFLTALPRPGPPHPSMRTLMTRGRRARRTRTWRRSAAAVTWGRAGGAWATAAPRTLRVRCRGPCLATCLLVGHWHATKRWTPLPYGCLWRWALPGLKGGPVTLPAARVCLVACQSWAAAHRPGRSCAVEGGPAGARGCAVQRTRRRPGRPHLRRPRHRPDPGAQP